MFLLRVVFAAAFKMCSFFCADLVVATAGLLVELLGGAALGCCCCSCWWWIRVTEELTGVTFAEVSAVAAAEAVAGACAAARRFGLACLLLEAAVTACMAASVAFRLPDTVCMYLQKLHTNSKAEYYVQSHLARNCLAEQHHLAQHPCQAWQLLHIAQPASNILLHGAPLSMRDRQQASSANCTAA